MAVMTSQKTLNQRDKPQNSRYKTRPITATLDQPLILDIKLLKKLDMTTFTKKGLIALSKLCGISLIRKTEGKRKSSKKPKEEGTGKGRRKQRKHATKPGTRIRFKTTESVDEDSADVICKVHAEILKSPGKRTNRKLIVSDIINAGIENIIPEPCKTCCRSEHPERFHSHPKTSTKLSFGVKTKEKNVEKVIKNSSEKKKKKKMEKSCGANQDSSQESLSPNEENVGRNSTSPKLEAKSATSIKIGQPEPETKPRSKNVKKHGLEGRLSNEKKSPNAGESRREENQGLLDESALRYITGCYLCGKQVSPKMRMKHEESCILEWRTRNSLLSPDKRKPEPKRPDFRFTVTGDLDCEATFQSIWANHKDSLLPCKKCGRTFFPDRIQRHENCCNNAPINNKYKH